MYKEDLSPQHARLLRTFLNEAGLDAFLLELHEMIVLKLRGPQAESSFNPRWRYGLVCCWQNALLSSGFPWT